MQPSPQGVLEDMRSFLDASLEDSSIGIPDSLMVCPPRATSPLAVPPAIPPPLLHPSNLARTTPRELLVRPPYTERAMSAAFGH